MHNFHKFDSFFLFDFNIAKMHVFCSFLIKRLLLFQRKNNVFWQPVPKKSTNLRFWSDGADFRTETQEILMLEQ